MGYTFLTGSSGSSDPAKADKYTTQAKTANFTAAPGYVYLVDTTSGTVTATLPAASSAGQQLVIKRVAGTNPVTVTRSGSDTIGAAATSADITLDNESWELTSSGSGQWNLTAGNKTLASLDNRFVSSSGLLSSGEETFHRLSRVDSFNLTNQRLQLTYFTARKSETTTQGKAICGGVAAATPTLIRYGLYLIAANGDGTLVASTVNDTTLLAAANTPYTKAWSTPYAKVAGQRYAFGVLSVAATAGSLSGIVTSGFTAELAAAPRQTGHLPGQADLPSSFTDAGLTATPNPFYAAILP